MSKKFGKKPRKKQKIFKKSRDSDFVKFYKKLPTEHAFYEPSETEKFFKNLQIKQMTDPFWLYF